MSWLVDFNYSCYKRGERRRAGCGRCGGGCSAECTAHAQAGAITQELAERWCFFVCVSFLFLYIRLLLSLLLLFGVECSQSDTHLLSTPPSSEALRHSGGERRLCTSATVTLYLDVELRSDSRPGTEQNTSLGLTTPPKRPSLFTGMAEMLLFLDRETGPGGERG